MKIRTFFLSFLVILCASCGKANDESPSNYINFVDFPEAPIQIMSNMDENSSEYDCKLINYFNIVQVEKHLYYMYYAAFGLKSGDQDIDQGLFFAYSRDGMHWVRKKPDGRNNLILENGIQEQSVFLLPSDRQYPFRLIANIKEGGKYKLCMWKSDNGYDFDFSDKVVLLEDRLHDTQNVIVPHEKSLCLYTRLWNESSNNRRNGIGTYDLEGQLLSPIDTLVGDYLYNSAASYVNKEYDLLLPTYMNNLCGENRSDIALFKAFINSGAECTEIETNLNKWLKKGEKWRIAAPGIIDLDGEKYIAFYTWTWSHDENQPENGVSRYYLIRINLYINGEKII